MPTMTVPSAAMRRLRRELQISRNRSEAPLAPTGVVVAKKPSKPFPAPAPRCNPEPTAPCVPPRLANGDAGPERARRPTPTTSTSTRSGHGAAPPAEVIKMSKCIRKGAQVRVRTRVGTVCTGQHLVLWLRAVVVSAADEDADGCLRVAYDYTNGKFPRISRVSPNDVKLHVVPPDDASGGTAVSTGCSTTTSDHSARTSSLSQQDKDAPPPRPTVAGKKLPLLKKLEKEMLSSSKAIMDSWAVCSLL